MGKRNRANGNGRHVGIVTDLSPEALFQLIQQTDRDVDWLKKQVRPDRMHAFIRDYYKAEEERLTKLRDDAAMVMRAAQTKIIELETVRDDLLEKIKDAHRAGLLTNEVLP
jgi:hypothetical protein